ncbi:hypothetical protein AKO1_013913 [Acrasis kona]|uniref:RNA ligase domain-containing protein n=1 Tax=Acrasis kona TaxID=1008807 RepID=A0AAW2Z1H4_9EUKA
MLNKFPRTHHLFESKKGRMSREDLLMDEKESEPFYKNTITIEEKIDGSNIGFSLDPKSLEVRAQNRSHFVTSQSHSQFKLLDSWIEEHKNLYSILHPHYTLFGEWMAAKHSIFYNHLPGLFIAFDIYDNLNKRYLSVMERNARLKGTSIPIVRCVARGLFEAEDDVKALLDQESVYTSGPHSTPLEGVYIRVDDDVNGCLLHRAKVVRSDFIQTVDDSSHWSTQVVVKNVVDFEWKCRIDYGDANDDELLHNVIPPIHSV